MILTVWSLVAAGHALAQNVFAFVIARLALGFGEAGNFPGAIKATAEWFPKKERALATGIFNSGSNVGQIIAAGLVPVLAIHFGWQAAFIATGLTGLIWVMFWWPIYRRAQEHSRLARAELAYIESRSGRSTGKISWRKLLPYRQTWAFAAGKFMTDSIWWFYVFWFPKFMHEQFGLDIKTIGLPMIAVYVMATFGSVIGGWESSWLLACGWTTIAARKTAMLTLRNMCGSGRCRSAGFQSLGGGVVDWAGDCGASRIFLQFVHAGVRHVSTASGRISRGTGHVHRAAWEAFSCKLAPA